MTNYRVTTNQKRLCGKTLAPDHHWSDQIDHRIQELIIIVSLGMLCVIRLDLKWSKKDGFYILLGSVAINTILSYPVKSLNHILVSDTLLHICILFNLGLNLIMK
jgi:hypothetical protein